MLKYFRQRKILETFRNFHKNRIFDTSVFTTAVRKSRSHFGPFSPGSILEPKMHFGAQNAFLGPEMHFWLQNAPRRKGSKTEQTFPHRCSKNRRVKNVNFVEILQSFQKCALSKIVSHTFHIFVKLDLKSIIFALCTKHL